MLLPTTLLAALLLGTTTATPTSPATPAKIPTLPQAALQARALLRSESIATLSTIFPSGEPHGLEGQPFGIMDYYADCSPSGNPTLLVLPISTTFHNAVAENATLTLSIRSHSAQHWSAAAHSRLSIQGRLVREEEDVQGCFVRKHPDSKLWVPGNRIHESYWARLEVTSVFFVGGFGNVAYIGWIPLEVWRGAELEEEEGKGWGWLDRVRGMGL